MAAVASAGRFTAERQSAKLHVLFRLLRGPARQLCRGDRAERRPAQAGAPDDHGRAVRRRRVADAVPGPGGAAVRPRGLAMVPAGRPHAVQGAPEARGRLQRPGAPGPAWTSMSERRRPRDRVGSMA